MANYQQYYNPYGQQQVQQWGGGAGWGGSGGNGQGWSTGYGGGNGQQGQNQQNPGSFGQPTQQMQDLMAQSQQYMANMPGSPMTLAQMQQKPPGGHYDWATGKWVGDTGGMDMSKLSFGGSQGQGQGQGGFGQYTHANPFKTGQGQNGQGQNGQGQGQGSQGGDDLMKNIQMLMQYLQKLLSGQYGNLDTQNQNQQYGNQGTWYQGQGGGGDQARL